MWLKSFCFHSLKMEVVVINVVLNIIRIIYYSNIFHILIFYVTIACHNNMPATNCKNI